MTPQVVLQKTPVRRHGLVTHIRIIVRAPPGLSVSFSITSSKLLNTVAVNSLLLQPVVTRNALCALLFRLCLCMLGSCWTQNLAFHIHSTGALSADKGPHVCPPNALPPSPPLTYCPSSISFRKDFFFVVVVYLFDVFVLEMNPDSHPGQLPSQTLNRYFESVTLGCGGPA